jgi:hypothetical protein
MLPDLLWPIFTIAGLEYAAARGAATDVLDVAVSHSLVMVMIWSGLLAGAHWLWRRRGDPRQGARASWLVFGMVLSHWLLDFTSHRHALAPGAGDRYGLDLWNSFPLTILVEGGFWLLALALYVRATHAARRSGLYAFWPVVAFLTVVWVTNIRKGAPPPEAVAGSLVFFSLLVAWAFWIDRVRPVRR